MEIRVAEYVAMGLRNGAIAKRYEQGRRQVAEGFRCFQQWSNQRYCVGNCSTFTHGDKLQ